MTRIGQDRPVRASGPRASAPSVARAGVPHRTLILVTAAITVLAVVATWLVAFSSVLGVRTVTVRGEHSLSAAQVTAAARITRGTPLIRLDPGAVARRVERLSDVASARVRTSYPGTVVISITERSPVGYLQSGARYVLVDRTGTQYRTQAARPAGLPLFSVPSGAGATATGRAVATVAASLPTALLARIASIQAFDPTAITLLLTDHVVVHWGSADRSAAKAQILPALLAQLGSTGTQVDVSNPALPFTR